MHDTEDNSTAPTKTRVERDAPGGPYFGRLLIVLFAAVAFCAVITWVLSTMTMSS